MPIDRNSAQYITGATYKPTQTSAPGVWDLDDQANNIAKNLWPLPPQAVQRSLRFNSADSAYLNRTPASAGSRTTWTWSAWVKRAGLYTTNAGPTIFDVGPDNGNFMFIRFLSDTQDTLDFGWTVSNSVAARLRSTASFRDPSAWYHIVAVLDTTNATSTDRMRLYVNGQRLTSFGSTTYPAQNTATCYVNATNIHYLGRSAEPTYRYMDGYISEVNLIDGQALDATSFGETDAQTGVWVPKRYSGTYGTNGFRLSFANNSSTTALGYDSSGQGNNWTANNFSVTPGVNNDVFVDVPSLYGTDTGLGGEVLGNYATLNPLQTNSNGQTLSDGNLQVTMAAATDQWRTNKSGTVLPRGKWYFEATVLTMPAGSGAMIGIGYINVNQSGDTYISKYANQGGSAIEFGAQGNTIGAAIDLETGRADYYKNGILTASFTGLDLTKTYEVLYAVAQPPNKVIAFNFGQRPFVYTAPSGFKALCTTNLPAPAIGQTSSNQADNHFAAVTYIGNGGTQTISTLDFQPDLVWIKRRDSNWSHAVYDSIRGAGSLKALSTNATDAEGVFNADTTYGYLSSFNNNGFTVVNGSTGGYTNFNNATYVAWCWNAGGVSVTNNAGTNNASVASIYRANKSAGFSIVTYTGSNTTNGTVAHGLGAAPSLIILKNRATDGWFVGHTSLGWLGNLRLESTSAFYNDAGSNAPWGDTAPTSNVFTVSIGGGGWANASGNNYVAYCWAEIPGYSAFGKYDAGSNSNPFIYTGFKPAFVMIKSYSGAYDQAYASWTIYDNKRNPTNKATNPLFANLSAAEGARGNGSSQPNVLDIDLLSNGFKILVSATEINYGLYVYAAFAETPARLSTAR